MTIHRVFSLLKSPGPPDAQILELFKSQHEAFDVRLVTTNWDTEAESALELLGIHFNYGLDEITGTGRRPAAHGTPVLKLHGCTNRGYCDCCRSVIRFEGIEDAVIRLELLLNEHDFESFEDSAQAVNTLRSRRRMENSLYAAARKCPDCGVDVTLRVGTFSYRKDLNAHAFYTIWDKARTSLQFAEKGLFIGYSLPEADIEIRHLLKSAQLSRRDESNLSIDVVLKSDCEAGERYRRFFGLRDEQIFQGGLQEWIANRHEG